MARCTVERRMRALGLHGARRGKKIRTTTPDPGHQRAADLVKRDFTASRPNTVWVADFIYVAAWRGIIYVAFVVDVYSRAIVGWSASLNKRATVVLDALDMALWRRDRAGRPASPGLVHHSDAGSQYTSFRFTAHLMTAGIDASIGTVGDALDNALMESQISLQAGGVEGWPGAPRCADGAGSRCIAIGRSARHRQPMPALRAGTAAGTRALFGPSLDADGERRADRRHEVPMSAGDESPRGPDCYRGNQQAPILPALRIVQAATPIGDFPTLTIVLHWFVGTRCSG